MTLMDDVRAAGPAALHLPRALLQRGCSVRCTGTGRGGRSPVLLVHGLAGTDLVWEPLVDALHAAGFDHVSLLSYNSFCVEPADVLAALDRAAADALAETGTQGVHLVGHSLGGLLVRCAVQSGALRRPALTAVTIATPHGGSALAALAPGPCARMLRPSHPAPTGSADNSTRWVTFWSDGDRVVPPSSARFRAAGLDLREVHVPGTGHLTICRHPELVRGVVAALRRDAPDGVSQAA